jgi:coenzyme PQQ precursor peptide PqqA
MTNFRVVPGEPGAHRRTSILRKDNAMKLRWERPDFEHVTLGAEVTAYMGSTRLPE